MNNNMKNFITGIRIVPVTSTGISSEGEVEVYSNGLRIYLQSAIRTIATLDQTQIFTNKTISGSSNTLTNIPYSALVLTNSIVNADINSSAAIVYSKLNLSNSIVNTDIATAAAIAYSKLAAMSTGQVLLGNAGVPTATTLSGDITVGATGVTAIGANKVANSQLATIATATFKGRTTAGTGNVEDLTATQATALLNAFVGDSGSGGTKGLVPAPASGDAAAGKFLKASGAWALPPDVGVTTIGTIDSQTASSNGLVISGANLYAQSASATNPGMVNNTTQTLSGNKTLSGSTTLSALSTGIVHSGSGGALTSSLIVDADVSASAAIAYSKLALSNSIVNADVNTAAAIAFSKLASLTSAHILVGSAGNVATDTAVTGDVTITNAGVTAIGANKVTNAQLATIATATFKGRTTAGTGNVEDLTATQATALLNAFVGDSGSGGTKGLVPAPAAGDAAANKFLKADGTFSVPSGAGDVTGPSSSVDNELVLFSSTTGKVIKRAAGTGAVSVTSGVVTQGTLSLANGGTNGTDAAVNGGLVYSNASGYKITAAGSAGQHVVSAGAAAPLILTPGPYTLDNYSLAASVSANAMTIALKDAAGNDPTATSPVYISVRNATLTTGTTSVIAVTAALSVVITSGATLGTTNGVSAKFSVGIMNNAGTAELVVGNCGATNNTNNDGTITTIVMSAASDSSSVYYSTTARTSLPFRLLGAIVNTQATAGTYASSPSAILLKGSGVDFVPASTNWASYTPTISAWSTNATASGIWKRIGAMVEVEVNIALSGAPTGNLTSVTLPSGLTIDTANMSGTPAANQGNYGMGYYLSDTQTTDGIIFANYSSTTAIRPVVIRTDSTYNKSTGISATVPGTFASGDLIRIRFSLPIVGWFAYDWQ